MTGDILTPAVFVAFLLGMIVEPILEAAWARLRQKELKVHTPRYTRTQASIVVAVAFVFFASVMLFITKSTADNADCTKRLVRTFQTEQAIAKEERESFISAIQKSVALQQRYPDPNDPARIAAGKELTDQYLAAQAKAAKAREDNQAAQDAAWRKCG